MKEAATENTNELRLAGLKVTASRLAIFELLKKEGRPLKAGEIVRILGIDSPDLATVYRVLSRMVNADLVRKVNLQAGNVSFEVADMPHHHHLVCERCGLVKGVKISCEDLMPTHAEFKSVSRHNLEFSGLCRKCFKIVK